VQIPCGGGNLYSFSSTNSTAETFSIADSHQNAYTVDAQQGNTVNFAYAVNSSCDMSQKLYVSTSSSGGSEFIVRDIRGAKTSSPLGCQAVANGTAAQSGPFTAGQVISNIPGSYTPCAAGDLLIWAQQNGCGPPENLSSPSGAITDNVWYTGQGDGSRYTFGEGHGHFLTPNTSTIHFDVVMQNNSVNCSNSNNYTYALWEISPAPASGGTTPVPQQMSLGVGE
jgi:hypothetical protein